MLFQTYESEFFSSPFPHPLSATAAPWIAFFSSVLNDVSETNIIFEPKITQIKVKFGLI